MDQRSSRLSATEVIMEWAAWTRAGKRVSGIRPDGFSIPMGSEREPEFEMWCADRVEAALKTFGTREQGMQMVDLLVEHYWNGRPLDSFGRFAKVLERAVMAFRHLLVKELEQRPFSTPRPPTHAGEASPQ